jgi:hypothetical protein
MNNTITFPLTYGLTKANLPLIPTTIQDKNLCFLLDTGSNHNIIDKAVYSHFKDISEPIGEYAHFGIEGNQEQSITVKMPFSFEGYTFNPIFSIVNLDKAFSKIKDESGIPIHGLLGNRFFIEHGWILDFDKMELSWQPTE